MDRAASGVPRTLAAKAGAHNAPAKAITTSEGIGMHIEPSSIRRKTAMYPLSATSRWTVSVKTASRENLLLTSGNAGSLPTVHGGTVTVFVGAGGTVRPREADIEVW
jgi:hypothetical protein